MADKSNDQARVVSIDEAKELKRILIAKEKCPGIFDKLESYDEPEEFDEKSAAQIHMVEVTSEIHKTIREVENENSDVRELVENGDLSEELEEIFWKWEEVRKISELTTKFLEFYTISSLIIESMSIDILQRHLIEEEYQSSNKTENLLERQLSQREREDLLLRCRIIDESLQSELAHIRKIRNGFVHNTYNLMLLDDISDIEAEVERTNNAVEQISEIYSDGERTGVTIEFEK